MGTCKTHKSEEKRIGEWIIKDYEIRCYNILVKLDRVNIEKPYMIEREIKLKVKEIMKRDKCSKLTALKTYKAQLYEELICNKKS